MRRIASIVLLALSGVLLPLGLVSGWANATLFDSGTFSQRSVDLLSEPAVRKVLATKLTEQLALKGNEQAVNFRPGFQLAIEAVVDTDTFKSIFRTAVRRTHAAILDGQTEGQALNLSDSVAIISSTLQLPSDTKPGQETKNGLGQSLADTTQRLADLGIWKLDDRTAALGGIGVLGGLLCGAAAIALAVDRRRTAQILGAVVVVDGLIVAALVPVAQFIAGRAVGDPALADAVRGALGEGMADIMHIGLWTAAYGVVLAGAASMAGTSRRVTPAAAVAAVGRWADRRRATTAGSAVLGCVAIVAGLVILADPTLWARLAVLAAGLWLAYFGAAELMRLVRAVTPAATNAAVDAAAAARSRWRRVGVGTAVVVVLVGLMSLGLVLTTKGAAQRAEAAGVEECNGDASLCDLPLNLAMFPASHNSMSSAQYPGFLFGEHLTTIKAQLEAGVRALLIDTHYGVKTSARLPGSETPLIVTDRAAEIASPATEAANPALAEHAAVLAQRAPPGANAQRDIYLCHNFCELGAVSFSSVLGDLKTFLETNPDEVVVVVIQDAVEPVATARAFIDAGLEERVYTLRKDQPMPTVGDIVRSHRNLLVFSEVGGPGAPEWYQPGYEGWFQETEYNFERAGEMNCNANRGTADAPLFLFNHWLTTDRPNPGDARKLNTREFLEDRLRKCADERGRLPNVVAVNFAEIGALQAVTRDMNRELLDRFRKLRSAGHDKGARNVVAPSDTGPAPTVPPPRAVAPIGSATVLNALTGGDPAQFCQTRDATRAAVIAWAIASLSAPPAIRGHPDLAFGPVVERTLGASVAAAPDEIAAQAAPALGRAQAAVAALRGLGLDQSAIDQLADLGSAQVGGENPDPGVVQARLLAELRSYVGEDRASAAAADFAAVNPEPPGLFDLGDPTDAAARDAGYDCLAS
ncbi:MAG: hypothetical protein ACR2HV_06480 [Acidimicrobiales bacterium]